MIKMYDLIIIGGGPAGMNAAIYAARRKLSTLLIAKELGGQVKESGSIENYLGFKSETGPELANKFVEHLNEYDVEVLEDVRVKKVEKSSSGIKAHLEDGKVHEAKTALVATGSRKRKLDVPGEQKYYNKGITYCAICDGPVFTGKDVAVIGGGYSGTESALYMSKISEKVYIIEIEDSLYGEPVTIEQLKDKDNIKIITQAQIIEIEGDKMVQGFKYKDLRSGDIKKKDVSGIIVEIGVIPNSDIVDVKKDDTGHIRVDDNMRTSKKRIYAAGDVVDKGVKQICVSSGQACVAVLEIDKFLSSNT